MLEFLIVHLVCLNVKVVKLETLLIVFNVLLIRLETQIFLAVLARPDISRFYKKFVKNVNLIVLLALLFRSTV